MTRRAFLSLAVSALGGLWLHHRPGHGKGRPRPTTTTTTLIGATTYPDIYLATY